MVAPANASAEFTLAEEYSAPSLEEYSDRPISFYQKLDYFPLVSTITGLVKAVFGILEMVFGVLLLPFQFGAHLWTQQNRSHFTVIDGAANMVRGMLALIPIFGNFALYLYDHSK